MDGFMIRIIICDDDGNCREELRQIVNHILFDKIEVSFECYEDGKELVKLLEDEKEIDADIIFMDIEMPQMDGLNTARFLRKNHVDAKIVFCTKHGECALQGYEVQAYDFLVKPISEKRVERLLYRYYKETLKDEEKYLLVYKRTRKEWIPIKRVRYFLSDRRKIKAVMTSSKDVAEFYMKMEEVEEKVGKRGFLRCHQSYLINVEHVVSWDGNNIFLTGNERIPVSRRYKETIKQKLKELSIT